MVISGIRIKAKKRGPLTHLGFWLAVRDEAEEAIMSRTLRTLMCWRRGDAAN